VSTEVDADVTATAVQGVAAVGEAVFPILPAAVVGSAFVTAPTVLAYVSPSTTSFVLRKAVDVSAEVVTLPSITGTVIRRSDGGAKKRTRGPSRYVRRP
jgi:hypothetical protein